MAVASSRKAPWVQMKKPAWSAMPVLDVRNLSSVQLHALSKIYASLASEELRAIAKLRSDPIRNGSTTRSAKHLVCPTFRVCAICLVANQSDRRTTLVPLKFMGYLLERARTRVAAGSRRRLPGEPAGSRAIRIAKIAGGGRTRPETCQVQQGHRAGAGLDRMAPGTCAGLVDGACDDPRVEQVGRSARRSRCSKRPWRSVHWCSGLRKP